MQATAYEKKKKLCEFVGEDFKKQAWQSEK